MKTTNKAKRAVMTRRRDNRLLPLKVAEVQVLKKKGNTYDQIQKLLGYSHATIKKYLDMQSEEIEEVKTTIKNKNLIHDNELADLAYGKIKEKINDFRPYELTGLYKISRDFQQPKQIVNQGNQLNIQVNVNKDKVTFEEATVQGEE